MKSRELYRLASKGLKLPLWEEYHNLLSVSTMDEFIVAIKRKSDMEKPSVCEKFNRENRINTPKTLVFFMDTLHFWKPLIALPNLENFWNIIKIPYQLAKKTLKGCYWLFFKN